MGPPGRGGRAPAFSGRGGGRITSLQPRDAAQGGRGARGRYKKTLNGNFMRTDGGGGAPTSVEETDAKLQQTRQEDALEAEFGFPLFTSGEDKLGWLMNMQPSCMENRTGGHTLSAVDCYFMQQDGGMFKARIPFAPYLYLQVAEGCEFEVEGALRRRFEGLLKDIEQVTREDLDLKNHLSGLKRKLLKLSFWNVQQLMEVKRELMPEVMKNKARAKTTQAYAELAAMQAGGSGEGGQPGKPQDAMEALQDMREYDVPYHVRFAIDCDIRCGHWFTVRCTDGVTTMTRRADLLQRAEPRICAWDIETTKLPLQFPNAEYDQVFMISYMIDRQGYLITNREVVGGDIKDFEFTPKPEFEGPFIIHNAADERALLRRFFDHMKEVKPAVYVTYNGDFFDFPFVTTRAAKHGFDLYQELGFKTHAGGEVLARHAVHMDCLHWVNRDSYLPQGSRGLKAVTKAKLGYDPVEVDPEEMVPMAQSQPQAMAAYSVSDAVSTYYLYMTYIHPFIFSLATIIPMPPDEVLRKGSGTLCEQLLMVQAYEKGIVCPNKHTSEPEAYYRGHLLESETYIGGKVEAIESGVFRSDLPLRFRCKPTAYQGLLDKLDGDLEYAIKHEGKMKVEDITNYADVRAAIAKKLEGLRDVPNREETPLIYHLDVAAMYPNIILTNRLQPSAIVNDEHCAACDFNQPGKNCLRQMEWIWRGEHYSATRAEYQAIKNQLAAEVFPPAQVKAGVGGSRFGGGGRGGGRDQAAGTGSAPGGGRYWDELSQEERSKLLTERLKKYAQKVYKRVVDKPVTERRLAGICQRENSFYVDTVRAFRDRRYEYKGLNKVWKNKLESAKSEGNPLKTAEASDMCVLYESLQLAHKCILNSFYGYVMRKGARWYSMEMAGVVTYTGANIIQRACALVEQLGRPLELDTDGIWCALPASFPENFKLKNKNGKELKISYPCVMLNVMVAQYNTNPQYQTLVDPETREYKVSSEMSIEFEVDGPYKAMILPASKEEGKSIKKRYAVFNDDGSLAELKGFEVKRRGELKLIKVFQAEVFEQFLAGSTLEECYAAVAAVANRWLDMLDTQGCDLTDEELIDHISEATTMSKSLEEYEGRKSCAITCAKRLGAFLGDERIKDKGLNCTYVIARKPENSPTSERAIPISIFSAEPAVARSFLRKWCGDVGSAPSNQVPDVRDIVDWGYYRERLSSAIQKIITIPAAMQSVANPCPRVRHPDWLHKKVATMNDRCQQVKLHDLLPRLAKKQSTLAAKAASGASGDADMEDMLGGAGAAKAPAAAGGAADQQQEGEEGGIVLAGSSSRRGKENVAPNKGAAAGGAQQQPPAPAGPKPDLGESYKAWVQYQKNRWRQLRTERKRRKAEAEAAAAQEARARGRGGAAAAGVGAGPAGPGERTDVGRLLRQQAAALTSVPWQVLQLADTNVPGRFKMWFLAEGRVHHVHVTVSRTLYLDSEVPLEEGAHLLAQVHQAPGPLTQEAGLGGTPGAGLATLMNGMGPGARLVRAPNNKQLPGGRKAVHLYQVTLPEPQYLAQASALATALAAPHIRAVYEERTPLSFHAALSVGCVVRVAPGAASRPLTADFALSDFVARPSSEVPYLDGPALQAPSFLKAPHLHQQAAAAGGAGAGDNPLGPHLKYVSLFCSGDAGNTAAGGGSSGTRGMYCLYMPAAARALLVVVQPSAGAAREVLVSMLDKFWRDTLTQLGASAQGAPQQVEFSVEYARDALDAGRTLQRSLLAHKAELRGSGPLVTVQGPQTAATMAATMLPALSSCPCVDVPCHADDSKYPALQWQARAARRAIQRVAGISGWLRERVALTRFAQVPLANLAGDATVAVCDALMARGLRSSDHLLWVKDPALPDLGVEERDDAQAQLSSLLAGTGAGISTAGAAPPATSSAPVAAASSAWSGNPVLTAPSTLRTGLTQGSPEILTPGAYRSIVVELKLHHLAVAAIQQSTALSDLEGTGVAEASGGPAGGAFKVLKSLMAHWLHEAETNSNVIADVLLQSLYRWVSNPDSSLHDPALQRAVQGLMAKLFAQLVSEMRKLGAVIVAAHFGTVIIATGKRNMAAAVGYTGYLCEALRRRELFSLVELTPVRWWHTLLLRDLYNWGGIEATVPQDPSDQPTQQQVPLSGEEVEVIERPSYRFHWNLMRFLPPKLHEYFETLMAEFIYLPWKEAANAAAAARKAREEAGQGDVPTQQGGGLAGADGGMSEDVQLSYLSKAVPTFFTQRILSLVAQIEREVHLGSDNPAHQFPQLAGSHLSREELGTPALAFVRTVCHLMGLDNRCVDGVALLRRQALKLLHVREFSTAAEFREVCLALTLPDVICSYCNDCRDLDLCRDHRLAEQSVAQGGHGWQCSTCQQHYHMPTIERRLVTALQQHIREYLLQDLQCVRCRACTSGHLKSGCGVCGGEVTLTLPAELFSKRLTVFQGVARHHGFPLLHELASWALAEHGAA